MFKQLTELIFGRRKGRRPNRVTFCPRGEGLEDRKVLNGCSYDVNGDGQVSIGDLVPIIEELRTQIATGDAVTLINARTDVNGDGATRLGDLIELIGDLRAHEGQPYAAACSAGIAAQEAAANPATGTAVNLVNEMIVDAFSVVSLSSDPLIIKQFYVEIVIGTGDEIFPAIDLWGDLNGDNLPDYIASATADGDEDNNPLTFEIQVTEFLDPQQVRDFQIRALPDVKGEGRQVQFSLVGLTAYEYDGTPVIVSVGNQPQTLWTIVDAAASISVHEHTGVPAEATARDLFDEMNLASLTIVPHAQSSIAKQLSWKLANGSLASAFAGFDLYSDPDQDGIPNYLTSATSEDGLTIVFQVTEILQPGQAYDFWVKGLADASDSEDNTIQLSFDSVTAYGFDFTLVGFTATYQPQTLWTVINV